MTRHRVPSEPVVWIAVHDLSRTGVPIVLARLLRALSPSRRANVHVVAVFGGPLRAELEPLCASLTVLEPTGRRSWTGAAAVGLSAAGSAAAGDLLRRTAWGMKLVGRQRPDVVVAHGAGAWQVVRAVPGRPPVVLHLHELATGLDRSIPPADQAAALRSVRLVMAVSEPVVSLAVQRGAMRSRVQIVPGVVDPASFDVVHTHSADPDAPPWVLGAGTPGWRKGTDRLAAVAYSMRRQGCLAQVGWVGGAPRGVDAQAVGSPDPVTWFDGCDDPWSILDRAAAVVVPSREDPLPLVALEAGARAKPVVAMPTGGLPALLDSGRGLVGSNQDLRWFVQAVAGVLDSPESGREMGRALREHVQVHHDASRIAPVWWDTITSVARG